jgi:hypothetical protein
MGEPQQAYARFNDSVNNFPRAFDSFSALSALVKPVNPWMTEARDHRLQHAEIRAGCGCFNVFEIQ